MQIKDVIINNNPVATNEQFIITVEIIDNFIFPTVFPLMSPMCEEE